MPYSGPGDDTLPERIKKLSAIKRRAFVAAFNSAQGDHRTGESAPDRESRAFAVANAAANRAGEKDMTEPQPDETGEKYDHDAMVMPVEPPPFAAGAQSFDEYDRYREEEKRQQALSYTFSTFQALLYNIMENDEMAAAERVSGMKALVDQLAARLDEVAADPNIAFKATQRDGERALAGADEAAQGDEDGALTIFKDRSGRYRWLAVHSNRYQDREKEFFPEQAHVEYVEWANSTKQFPPLRLWHAPFDIGPGDGLDYSSEGFVVSTGTFYPGMEQVARNLKAMADERRLGCSHGFTYKATDYRGGVYHRYRSFEVTALPMVAAANLLTDFGVKEALMLNPVRRKFFEEALGEEGAKTLEAQLASLGQKAQAEGVAFKDIFVGIDLDAATDTTPDAPAAGTKEAPVDATALPGSVPATPTAAAAPAAAPVAAAPAADPTTGAPVAAADAMPTAADAASNAPLPPSLDAVAQGEALKSFKDMLSGALGEALAPFVSRLEAVETGVKALSETKDATIAAAIRPAVGPTGTIPASLAASNVVTDPEALAAIKAATEQVTDDKNPISPHFKALQRAYGAPGGD
jgi:cation transport regulator ChaB